MEGVKCKMKTACRLSIVACLILGGRVSTRAEAEATANPMIKSFMFRDAPIEYAMSMLGETWGRHIVVNSSAKATTVRTFLKDIDCEAALKAVCQGHGLWYREDPQSGVIFVLSVEEFTQTSLFDEKKFVEVVTLSYPRAEDIAAAIHESYRDVVVFTAPDLDDDDEIGDISRALDRMDQLGDRSVVMTGDANQTSFSSSGRGRQNSRRNGENLRGLENIRRFTDDIERTGKYIEYTSRQPGTTTVNIGAEGAQQTAAEEPRAKTLGVVFISIVRKSNSIVLRSADRDMLAQIRETVKKLDVPKSQVLLEVRILQLDVSDAKDRDIGFIVNGHDGKIDGGFMQNLRAGNVTWTGETEEKTDNGSGYTSTRKNSSATTTLGPLDVASAYSVANHSVFQILNNHYQLRLNFLDGRGKVRSLATPSLMVADGEASRIFIGTSRHVMTGFNSGSTTVNQSTTTSSATTAKFVERDIGTSLVISPRIHADGTVTLRILQENSTALAEIAKETSAGLFYEQPIKKEIITSAIVAKGGETVALGGLMQHDKTDHVYKIPLLGEIPYLGALFRHTSKEETDYELMVLIRPTVISEASGAAGATAEFVRDNVQDKRNLHEALEKTREQRRANAERRLSETNPEGTNTLINAEIENKWIPTSFKGMRHFANEEMEDRGVENKEAGNTDK